MITSDKVFEDEIQGDFSKRKLGEVREKAAKTFAAKIVSNHPGASKVLLVGHLLMRSKIHSWRLQP